MIKRIFNIILSILTICYSLYIGKLYYNYKTIGDFISFLTIILVIFTFSSLIYYPIYLLQKKYLKNLKETSKDLDFSFILLLVIYFPILVLFSNYLVIFIGFIFITINLSVVSENNILKYLKPKQLKFLNILVLITLSIIYFENIYFYFGNIKYLKTIKNLKIECNDSKKKYLNIDLKKVSRLYNKIIPVYQDLKKETNKNCEMLIFTNKQTIKITLTNIEFTRNKSSKRIKAYFIEFDDMPNCYFISEELYKYFEKNKR